MNISTVELDKTARTRFETASQRAEHLASLGVKSVLELCVGPSLKTLEKAYKELGMEVAGNDIDKRWEAYYPQGKWFIGDAKSINSSGFDALIIAPPLTRGCTGRRDDALSLFEVYPRYEEFLAKTNKVLTFVMPGKTLKCDKSDLFKFLAILYQTDCTRRVEVVPLVSGCTKYVDVYWYKT